MIVMTTVPAIQTEDLDKSFDQLDVLRGVNLKVFPGEVVCVLGPSGSGKSTLLRCLNWLSPPTRGKVWISGQLLGVKETPKGDFIPQSDAELRAMRSQIGMVFQGFNLWPHRTALENIAEGPLIVRKLSKKAAKNLGMYFLEQVGLADKWNVYPSRLSGGQQQRVAIARALAMEPKILLFDEPTSALDPELVGEVLAVMRDLALKHTTMLVVTHEIGFAAEAADRIVFMDQGQIVEENTPREFIRNPQEARSQQFLNQFLSRNPFVHIANV
jgi:polar amino acid transport system ATP-binding protein